MNKFALTLGILLLAGLSFADGCKWIGYLESKYACDFLHNAGGYPPSGGALSLMQIVGNYDSRCTYWTGCRDMGNDLAHMDGAIWGRGGMWNDAGCYGETDVSGFRQGMLAYSAASMDFRAKFLAGLRSYLAANPVNKTSLMNDITDAKENYLYCLSDVPCCYNPTS